jgi:hypothetical protein
LIGRRALLLALMSFPTGVFSEAAVELSPTLTAEEMRLALQDALQGQPLEQIGPILSARGARDVTLTDLMALDLAKGTTVAEGLRAGDQIALVLFGLRRGLLTADRRVRVIVPYDAGRIVTGIDNVTLIAK